jgi:hypothetical protein
MACHSRSMEKITDKTADIFVQLFMDELGVPQPIHHQIPAAKNIVILKNQRMIALFA